MHKHIVTLLIGLAVLMSGALANDVANVSARKAIMCQTLAAPMSNIGSTDVIQSSRQSANTTIMSVISQMSNSFKSDLGVCGLVLLIIGIH